MGGVLKCVFADINFAGSEPPTHRGPNGHCFAQVGEQMNSCCFSAAKTLILLSQIRAVNDAIESFKGNSMHVRPRRIGLVEAVHHNQ